MGLRSPCHVTTTRQAIGEGGVDAGAVRLLRASLPAVLTVDGGASLAGLEVHRHGKEASQEGPCVDGKDHLVDGDLCVAMFEPRLRTKRRVRLWVTAYDLPQRRALFLLPFCEPG